MKYLHGTCNLPLILVLSDNSILTWWVDASYAVHQDMWGHTGGTLSMGRGSMYSTSSKQKMVSRSSTEAKLIGVYDMIPQLIWTGNFILSQEMNTTKILLMQDNTSTMRLEKNGQGSSTKQMKHLDIQYLHIKEKVDCKGVEISYCPTKQMMANFFTKLLQISYCPTKQMMANFFTKLLQGQ